MNGISSSKMKKSSNNDTNRPQLVEVISVAKIAFSSKTVVAIWYSKSFQTYILSSNAIKYTLYVIKLYIVIALLNYTSVHIAH